MQPKLLMRVTPTLMAPLWTGESLEKLQQHDSLALKQKWGA